MFTWTQPREGEWANTCTGGTSKYLYAIPNTNTMQIQEYIIMKTLSSDEELRV